MLFFVPLIQYIFHITAIRLPDKGEKCVEVCLKTVEFAPDYHAFCRTVTIAVLYYNVYVYAGPVTMWAGQMKLAGINRICLLHERVFHVYILFLFIYLCKGVNCDMKRFNPGWILTASDALSGVLLQDQNPLFSPPLLSLH